MRPAQRPHRLLASLRQSVSSGAATLELGPSGGIDRPRSVTSFMGDDRTTESARLAALWDLALLDSEPESVYDDITRAAAEICDMPMAVISLVDRHRQWFKSCFGWAATETPREHAFCALTIQFPERATVIGDASVDARFTDSPLVTAEPWIRFYAGVPLVTGAGQAIGALCVMDRQTRRLEALQIAKLRYLAGRVMALFGQRRTALERPMPRN